MLQVMMPDEQSLCVINTQLSKIPNVQNCKIPKRNLGPWPMLVF